jgi:hypothetical protein
MFPLLREVRGFGSKGRREWDVRESVRWFVWGSVSATLQKGRGVDEKGVS